MVIVLLIDLGFLFAAFLSSSFVETMTSWRATKESNIEPNNS